MTKPFSWRDDSQGKSAQSLPPSTDRVEQGVKAGYEAFTVWLPASVPSIVLGFDQWHPLSGIGRVNNEDRVFILGFCAALQLSDSQKLVLLEQYAQRYHDALKRAGSNPAKYGMAKRAANQWLGAGASGFTIRD